MEVFKQIVSGAPVEMPSHVLPLARDLIKRLLIVDYTHRLGFGGVEEVMRHPWFQSIDWDALYQCSTRAPLQMQLSGEGDTSLYAQYPDGGEVDPLAEEGNAEEATTPRGTYWKGF